MQQVDNQLLFREDLWILEAYKDRHQKMRARKVLRFVKPRIKIELGQITPAEWMALKDGPGRGRWKVSREDARRLRPVALQVAEMFSKGERPIKSEIKTMGIIRASNDGSMEDKNWCEVCQRTLPAYEGTGWQRQAGHRFRVMTPVRRPGAGDIGLWWYGKHLSHSQVARMSEAELIDFIEDEMLSCKETIAAEEAAEAMNYKIEEPVNPAPDGEQVNVILRIALRVLDFAMGIMQDLAVWIAGKGVSPDEPVRWGATLLVFAAMAAPVIFVGYRAFRSVDAPAIAVASTPEIPGDGATIRAGISISSKDLPTPTPKTEYVMVPVGPDESEKEVKERAARTAAGTETAIDAHYNALSAMREIREVELDNLTYKFDPDESAAEPRDNAIELKELLAKLKKLIARRDSLKKLEAER